MDKGSGQSSSIAQSKALQSHYHNTQARGIPEHQTGSIPEVVGGSQRVSRWVGGSQRVPRWIGGGKTLIL